MNELPRLVRVLQKYQITPGNILLVCAAFWLTAVSVRGAIFWLVYHGIIPEIFVRGYHIHHFVSGFLMLLLALFIFWRRWFSRYIPLALLGSALGLIFDEFGFWARGKFDYWSVVNLIGTVSLGCLLAAFYLYAKKHDLGYLSKKRLMATLVPILIFSVGLYLLFHFQNLLLTVYGQ